MSCCGDRGGLVSGQVTSSRATGDIDDRGRGRGSVQQPAATPPITAIAATDLETTTTNASIVRLTVVSSMLGRPEQLRDQPVADSSNNCAATPANSQGEAAVTVNEGRWVARSAAVTGVVA